MLSFVKLAHLLCIFVVVSHCRRKKGGLIYDRVRREGRLVYDWTDSLEKIMEGKLSIGDLSSLNSGVFKPNKGNRQDVGINVLFETDCKPFWNETCKAQINEVATILQQAKEILTQEKEIFLLLSIRVDITQKHEIEMWNNNVPLRIPADKFIVYVMLPETTTCEEVGNVTDAEWEQLMAPRASAYSFNDERAVGLGYGEDLIGCQILNNVVKNVRYIITYVKFGETKASPESFSIFTNSLTSLHARNTHFIKQVSGSSYKNPSIDYYLAPQGIPDTGRVRRLNTYGHDLVQEVESKLGVIVPIPIKSSSYNKATVIPFINAETCRKSIKFPWHTPAALQALSQQFSRVVLTHYEWKSLMSQETFDFYGKYWVNRTKIDFEVIIDYSDMLLKDICKYNWTDIEKDLFEIRKASLPQHPLINISLKTIVLSVDYLAINFQMDFTKRVSHSFEIGCAFKVSNSEKYNLEIASNLVGACKNINGNLYILQSYINVGLKNDVTKNEKLYFEDMIRPKLEELKNIRSLFLTQHTTATVYLQLSVVVESYKSQVFCDSKIYKVNEQVEAITNWGQETNITLIVGQAFHNKDEFSPNQQSWMDVLRPEVHFRELYEYNPSFVLRNYPKGINNWTLDSCIEWTKTPPNLEKNYFRNKNIGAVFDTTVLRSQPTSTKEYEIMLQFVLNRFDFVAIVIEKDRENSLNALTTLASRNVIGSNPQIYLNIKLTSIPQSKLQVNSKYEEFISFLENIKRILGSNISLLGGLHFDWDNFLVFSNIKKNSKLHLEYENPLDSWNSETIDRVEILIDAANSFGLRSGFLLSISSCIEFIWDSAMSEEWSRHMGNLFAKTSYIVCHYNLQMKDFENSDRLGEILDTHLYTKRLCKQFYVHLDLFFHIDIKNYEYSPTTMDTYLNLLSYLKQFGTANNISYFVVNAFDNEYVRNGWWEVENFEHLSEPIVYKEKYSEFVGAETWRPPALPEAAPIVNNDSDDAHLKMILVSTITGILVFSGLLTTYLYIRRRNKLSYLSEDEVKRFLKGRSHAGGNNAADFDSDFEGAIEDMNFNTDFELSILDISIDTQVKLGSGNFGTVHKGLANGKLAAIKRPNRDCMKEAFKSVLCEVKILCYVGVHTHVVEFLGAYVKEINKGILCIATEFCSNGSLKSYLEKHTVATGDQPHIVTKTKSSTCQLQIYDLHRFGKEIANGMAYIQTKKVVHRDLSARNILLDENLTCKISDFGLSRKLYEFETYIKISQEPLPWRWMAYESLTKREFTSKSDVWSYGVTLWEVYSLASTPFAERNGFSGFVDDLRDGMRLTIPQLATEDIYLWLQNCWNMDPCQRPTFENLASFFNSLCHKHYDILDEIVHINVNEHKTASMENE